MCMFKNISKCGPRKGFLSLAISRIVLDLDPWLHLTQAWGLRRVQCDELNKQGKGQRS